MNRGIVLACLIGAIWAACPSGPGYFGGATNGTCYWLSDREEPLFEATRACEREQNGNLTSVHDAFTNNKLYNTVKSSQNHPEQFWIGGERDFFNHTKWTWIDKTTFDYSNWATGQPDNNPEQRYDNIYVDTVDGKWYADEGFNQKFFVCQVSQSN